MTELWRRRWTCVRRRLSFFLVLLFASQAAWAETILIESRLARLNERDPTQMSVDRLVYRGGLRLSSKDARFGGLSGLLVSADGERFTAVSDGGHKFEGGLVYDLKNDLADVEDVEIFALTRLNGWPLKGKKEQDAEALTLDRDETLIVAFERMHRLRRYVHAIGEPETFNPPAGMEAAPENGGVEALATLSNGDLLAITENYPVPGGAPGALIAWMGDSGRWEPLSYATRDRFAPTGATTLPNGDVLVLERRFTVAEGPAARIRRIAKDAIRPGAGLDGKELATLTWPLSIDNMEGIAAREGERGETLVYLVSDDNFKFVQRTLLLMFELTDPG